MMRGEPCVLICVMMLVLGLGAVTVRDWVIAVQL